MLRVPAAIKWFVWPVNPATLELLDQAEPKTAKVAKKVYGTVSLFVILANKSK